MISYKNYLYWDSVYKNDDNEVIYRGINRFDTEKIDFPLANAPVKTVQFCMVLLPASFFLYVYNAFTLLLFYAASQRSEKQLFS